MQEAISLDTHLSWTVYLQTGGKEVGEHHSPAAVLPPPCSPCSNPQGSALKGNSTPCTEHQDGAGATSHCSGGMGKSGLTGAAQTLLADSQQHSAAEVAVGGCLEVLQPPGMLPIILHILQDNRAEGKGGHAPTGDSCPLSPPPLSAFCSQHVCGIQS